MLIAPKRPRANHLLTQWCHLLLINFYTSGSFAPIRTLEKDIFAPKGVKQSRLRMWREEIWKKNWKSFPQLIKRLFEKNSVLETISSKIKSIFRSSAIFFLFGRNEDTFILSYRTRFFVCCENAKCEFISPEKVPRHEKLSIDQNFNFGAKKIIFKVSKYFERIFLKKRKKLRLNKFLQFAKKLNSLF